MGDVFNTTIDDQERLGLQYVGRWQHINLDSSDVHDDTLSESATPGDSLFMGMSGALFHSHSKMLRAQQ